MEFNCSCMRMESFGIPCEHIVCVLVHEGIDELPRSLILARWTKTAKAGLQNVAGFSWDSLTLSQYGCLMDWFRQLANISCRDNEKFVYTLEITINLLKQFKEEDAKDKKLANDEDGSRPEVQGNSSGVGPPSNDTRHGIPRDLRICRAKGNATSSKKRKHHCEDVLDQAYDEDASYDSNGYEY